MNNIKYYIFGIILIIIQLLISEYVNIWPMLYIAVYPILLLVVPYNKNPYLTLITAFIIGLLIDFLADGVLGLNAASATAMTFFRNPVLRMITSKTTLEKITDINTKSIDLATFIFLSVICYSLFFIFYLLLDGWGYFSFLYTLLRFAINVMVNTSIAFIIWKSLVNRILT